MPSLNHYVWISDTQRIRVNVCEGEVHVTHEEMAGRGLWRGVNGGHIGPLRREQAAELAATITRGLSAGF